MVIVHQLSANLMGAWTNRVYFPFECVCKILQHSCYGQTVQVSAVYYLLRDAHFRCQLVPIMSHHIQRVSIGVICKASPAVIEAAPLRRPEISLGEPERALINKVRLLKKNLRKRLLRQTGEVSWQEHPGSQENDSKGNAHDLLLLSFLITPLPEPAAGMQI